MFAGKARTFPRVDHLIKGALFYWVGSLPSKIGQGWKGLPCKTLQLITKKLNYKQKSFITLGTE
jgi:hypothetical protein